MGALSAAKHSVRIWTPYFVPDQPMIAALSTAALRGVRIDVLTPANGDHPTVQWAARAHYWQVLEHGVRIFERPGLFDHSKLMLVDGAWCCLFGQLGCAQPAPQLRVQCGGVRHRAVYAAGILFDAARDASNEISAKALRARPLAIRLRDGVARLFTPFSSGTTCEEHCPWKERSMEHWLLDRRRPVAADAAELLAGGQDRRARALQRIREGAGRGRVAEVLVSDRTVTGRLKSPDSRGKTTIVATRVEPDLAERLSKYDVPYARVVESTWLRDVLSWILPAVAFFGVWFFLFRRFAEKQGMGGFLSIGKSRAKVFMEKNTGVTLPMSRVSMRPRPSWSKSSTS